MISGREQTVRDAELFGGEEGIIQRDLKEATMYVIIENVMFQD